MNNALLIRAIAQVPAGGRWAVAVSGGADSVALLTLLREHRPELELCVAHLNHQARGEESDADADFVAALCARLGVACEISRIDQIEPGLKNLPKNRSARFRALRIAYFKSVVAARKFGGVLVAHHADDQAESVLSRLLRGSGYTGLAGMSPHTTVGGLTILRPLLEVRREALREHLRAIGQSWREDSSNRSSKYLRNRIRVVLTGREEVIQSLIELGKSCAALRQWVRAAAPRLEESFRIAKLARLPAILAEESARAWLCVCGVPVDLIAPQSVADLIEMAADAASPARRDFPGRIVVRRRAGSISAESRR
jgi:tRNA(Ile)-lysidine synthase